MVKAEKAVDALGWSAPREQKSAAKAALRQKAMAQLPAADARYQTADDNLVAAEHGLKNVRRTAPKEEKVAARARRDSAQAALDAATGTLRDLEIRAGRPPYTGNAPPAPWKGVNE